MTKENFKTLFEAYFDAVRNYIFYRSGDAELATDIAQEAFMRIWEKQLDKPADQLVGLVYKIASNILVSKYRRQQVEIRFQKGSIANEMDDSPEDRLEFNELQTSFEQAISKMNETQRVVFLMSRTEGLKYVEIAERLDLSVKAIEKRMSQAIGFLKHEMKDTINDAFFN